MSKECKYFKKYCKCELDNKRCSRVNKYNYDTKEWARWCDQFKDLKLILEEV